MKLPVRVAFVAYHLSGNETGIGKVCSHFAEEMEKKEDLQLIQMTPPALVKGEGILYKILNRIRFELWYNFVIPFQIKQEKVDLYLEMNMLFPLFKFCKFSFFLYDLAFLKFPEFVTYSNYVRRIHFLKKIGKRNDLILTISDSTKFDFYEHTQSTNPHVQTCYLASSCQNYGTKKVIDEAEGYFLFVSTIEPRKNVAELIKAFYRFLDEVTPEFRLVLIGKMGWKTEEIVKVLESDPEKRKKVLLTGYVDEKELSAYYAGAKALVYPSHYEGFGLPILEAMIHETPVITCENSSLKEIGGDAVLYCGEDALSIAECMKVIYRDKERVAQLVLRSREQRKKFSWELFGEKVYQEIVQYCGESQ
ncbi:glycosyltransferase family 1 protein [Deltaproteobacteria bacterium TL4]